MSHYLAADREPLNGGKRGPECGCSPPALPAITILEGSPLEPFISQEPPQPPRPGPPGHVTFGCTCPAPTARLSGPITGQG